MKCEFEGCEVDEEFPYACPDCLKAFCEKHKDAAAHICKPFNLAEANKKRVANTYAKFQEEVVNSSVPTVVDFYADWCVPCKVIEPILDKLAIEFDGKVRFRRINADSRDYEDVVGQYGTESIPTIVFFSGGKALDTKVGAAPIEVFRKWINDLLSGKGPDDMGIMAK